MCMWENLSLWDLLIVCLWWAKFWCGLCSTSCVIVLPAAEVTAFLRLRSWLPHTHCSLWSLPTLWCKVGLSLHGPAWEGQLSWCFWYPVGILSAVSSSSACYSVALEACVCSPALSASEQALDHNQDREAILSEAQNQVNILSKEVLSLKDEKNKQVSRCWQFRWGTCNPLLSLEVPQNTQWQDYCAPEAARALLWAGTQHDLVHWLSWVIRVTVWVWTSLLNVFTLGSGGVLVICAFVSSFAIWYFPSGVNLEICFSIWHLGMQSPCSWWPYSDVLIN